MKGLGIGEKLTSNRYIIAASTVTLFLIMVMSSYSVLVYAVQGDEDKASSDTMFFRILKGDLNVCSPNYQYNITVCQMVMKDEELSKSVEEVANNTQANNAMNTTNSTNSTSYPPLSTNPEMVMNEEQLQALLSNSSLDTPKGVESVSQNDTGTSLNNDTQVNDIGKIYVDEYPQYEPLVIEQLLEDKIFIDNSLERPWSNNQQPLFMNNQTASNGVHDIEEPMPSKNGLQQQDNHEDSVSANESSSLEDSIDNPKADTSNLYSSIPIGMSLPLGN